MSIRRRSSGKGTSLYAGFFPETSYNSSTNSRRVAGGLAPRLNVSPSAAGDDAVGVFEYNADLFDPARVARFADHYLHLAQRVLAAPNQALARLDYLDGEERTRVLQTWNDTSVDWPTNATCLYDPIVARAKATPNAIAVIEPALSEPNGESPALSEPLGESPALSEPNGESKGRGRGRGRRT